MKPIRTINLHFDMTILIIVVHKVFILSSMYANLKKKNAMLKNMKKREKILYYSNDKSSFRIKTELQNNGTIYGNDYVKPGHVLNPNRNF